MLAEVSGASSILDSAANLTLEMVPGFDKALDHRSLDKMSKRLSTSTMDRVLAITLLVFDASCPWKGGLTAGTNALRISSATSYYIDLSPILIDVFHG